MKKVLIFGATSAIAEATARLWAAQGHHLYLVGRDAERLARIGADLRVRGAAAVEHAVLDLNVMESHESCIDAAMQAMGGLDLVLIAHGTLGDQRAAEVDFAEALRQLNTNGISAISLLTHLANRLEPQKSGTIVVISSVAGDRGRQSNYVYGTAKAAVSAFTQGLRQRLYKSGVGVVTIKPGFVDTPMTASFKKGLLWASPAKVARMIVEAADRQKPVAYTPGFWWMIMLIIRLIPEVLFRKLKL
jgi:decaprenylphospho-beta-D-erythro-pentofuranosid-2-ulose 2-reductase